MSHAAPPPPAVWRPPNKPQILANREEMTTQKGGRRHKISFHNPISFRQETDIRLDDAGYKENPSLEAMHDSHSKWPRHKRRTCTASQRQDVHLKSSGCGNGDTNNAMGDELGLRREESIKDSVPTSSLLPHRCDKEKARGHCQSVQRGHMMEHAGDEGADKQNTREQPYPAYQHIIYGKSTDVTRHIGSETRQKSECVLKNESSMSTMRLSPSFPTPSPVVDPSFAYHQVLSHDFMTRIPAPPFGYHVRYDFSNAESLADLTRVMYTDSDIVQDGDMHPSASKSREGENDSCPQELRFPKSKGKVVTKNAMRCFKGQERSLSAKNLSREPFGDGFNSTPVTRHCKKKIRGFKKQNRNHNAVNEKFHHNKLALKCLHRKHRYLTSRKRLKRKSKFHRVKIIHVLPFSFCTLNQNSNAQHSDTDLRDEGNREKKPENMSSASGASVLSADIFYSTKTDITDGCEVNPSLIELVGKPLADNESDGTYKTVKNECTLEKVDPNAIMVDFGNVGDVEIKKQSGKLNAAEADDQKIQYPVSRRKCGEDRQGMLFSKSPDEEARQNKKAHKLPNYACLFPSKTSPNKNVDGIDSVVLDCMRNALNEEIASMEKSESTTKPPPTPENLHRTSGHRKRGSQDGGMIKSKSHSIKKGCLRSNKEDFSVPDDEQSNDRSSSHSSSKSAIVKRSSSNEITPHQNIKSTFLSTPNLLSVIDVSNQPPISQAPRIIKSEPMAPNEIALLKIKQSKILSLGTKPDTASIPLARDMKLATNKRADKPQPTQSSGTNATTAGRTVEVDSHANDSLDVVNVLSRKESLTDIEKLTPGKRDVDDDAISSVAKAAVRFNEHRGRSPRRKSKEVPGQIFELASILSSSKDGDLSLDAEAKTLAKDDESLKKKSPLQKLKKSISLSPQGTNRSKKEVPLGENHLSASHGPITEFSEKSKPKLSKKSAKKKRVRIAPVHDDSPVRRSMKPQSTSPVQRSSRNAQPAKPKPKSSPAPPDEKENHAKKVSKKASKKSVSTPKAYLDDEDDVGEANDMEQETAVQECIYVPQASDVPEDDCPTPVEEHADEPSPVHVSPSQTDVSEKASKNKMVLPKASKTRKPDKDLQNAETGWKNTLVKNTPKPPIERAKSLKLKNCRKTYKLVKHSDKAKKSKEVKEATGDAENGHQPLVDNKTYSSELSRHEVKDEHKSSESVASDNKEVSVSQAKKPWSVKKEHKFKDGQHPTDSVARSHFNRKLNQSPKSSQTKQSCPYASTKIDLEDSHEEQLTFGSSVDKREFDEGSSVDAPSFGKKDLYLRQTRSGPALGLGKYAQKETDNVAKRVKLARENAINLAKQTRKNVVNSSSPGMIHVMQPGTSPIKKTNEDQTSPFSSMSTDLDLAAGFKRPRSSPYASRYNRRDHKVVRSMPKLDIKVEECTCATGNAQSQSPCLLPTCDNSVDYNVLNLGLNWMVQGVINRMPFLRSTREHNCGGTTAAGDTTNQQALSSTGVNH